MKDPRLVERQEFLLKQAREMIKLLQEDTINWKQIAQIGQAITTTSLTADMLANAHQYTRKI